MKVGEMGWTSLHLWIVLSAPVCAIFAVRAAEAEVSRERTGEADRSTILICGASGIIVCYAAATAPDAAQAIKRALLFCGLAYLAMYDLSIMAVPVFATLGLVAVGLGTTLWIDGVEAAAFHALGALAGWLLLRALDRGYRLVRGRSGLGEGDALVAAMVAAFVGAQALAWTIAFGGAVTLAWCALRRTGSEQPFPLAPGLAAGAGITVMGRQLGLGI